ncbi:MAG: 2-oxoacid:acceptor oxidoreductase family protein [Deltaproteobacteria bacterium]|nr:2-oxoacid:acceptor oxidoreductase family protein [Deltaproteobacteria bacterium]
MLRVRFHGRGGQGAKVASRVLGTAAFLEGYYAQDFPLYGAERRGAPIAAFTRISKEPVLERGVIAEPDIVIVMDETLLSDPLSSPLAGVREGCVVFINTTHSREEVRAKYKITAQVITLDITKISLDILGRPVLSALAGGVAARLSGLKEDSLSKGVEKETSEIITDRSVIEKNIEAAVHCYNAVESHPHPAPLPSRGTEVPEGEGRKTTVITVPFEPAITSSPAINTTGSTPMRKTGNWRLFRPVWDYEKCTKCMTCVARCPDGCIALNEDGFPYTDYENCKGCMICAEECPVKAITAEREVHSW